MDIAQQVIDGKTPTHAQVGVSMAEINSQMAQYYNLPTDEGVYVANVYEGSAAPSAGLQKGDIITAFDGKAVTSASDLQVAVREHNPGDKVDVTVNRDGQERTVTVTLGSDENQGGMYGSNRNQESNQGYGSESQGQGQGHGKALRFRILARKHERPRGAKKRTPTTKGARGSLRLYRVRFALGI